MGDIMLLSILFGCADVAPEPAGPVDEIIEVHKCSTLENHTVCDFDAISETGEDAFLSDLYGKPIVLELSAMWCGPCKQAGAALQETADRLPQITFLTVLIEDTQGNAPDINDIDDWKESLGIETPPVWGSSRSILTSNPIELEDHLYLDGWPTFYFIDSSGKLQEYVRGYNEEAIIDKALELE